MAAIITPVVQLMEEKENKTIWQVMKEVAKENEEKYQRGIRLFKEKYSSKKYPVKTGDI